MNLRAQAEQRARELGYTGVEAMLEHAYATDTPWTEVAAELGVYRVDSVSNWARKLGMHRGEGWYMERAQRAERTAFATPIGQAAHDPNPSRKPTLHELLTAAVQRAAQRVTTPAGRSAAARSLAYCCQRIKSEDIDLRLTPAEEAEYTARHLSVWPDA